jgi:hypothetical protein
VEYHKGIVIATVLVATCSLYQEQEEPVVY